LSSDSLELCQSPEQFRADMSRATKMTSSVFENFARLSHHNVSSNSPQLSHQQHEIANTQS
jgi:hypothetical protein